MIHLIPTRRQESAAKAILAERYFLDPVQKFALERVSQGIGVPVEYYCWLNRCLKTGDV